MSQQPEFSIVITCYDLGVYLQEALDSALLAAGRHDCEIIVVDDGSTDPVTRALLFGLDRDRFVVVEQVNMGLAKARNNGIARAKGAWIISLDADNRIRPALVEHSIRIMKSEPEVGIVYGDLQYFEGREGRKKVGPYDFAKLLQSNYIDACACFRRCVWERVGGYDEHMPYMGWEDWDLWLRCSVAGVSFRYVDEVFFDYRVRSGSMIEGTRERQAELNAYIFAKPQLRFLGPLRERYMRLLHGSREHISTRELVVLLWHRACGKLLRTSQGKAPQDV